MISPIEEKDYQGVHLKRSIRTVAKRKREWLSNVKDNYPFIKRDLSDLWLDQNYPEIINVAAGPSLNHDLDKIRELQNGRELICVDAALKFLLQNGIVPNYVISSDASPKIVDMLDGIDKRILKGTKLILNVIAHPKLPILWDGEIYWFVMANQFYDLDNRAMIQNLHSLISRIGTKLVPGGNVSSVALGFSLSVRNADKVYLFGHDFCWKKDMYCGGYYPNLAQERMEDEKKAGTIFETVNNHGESVLTNLSLKEFANWHNDVIMCAGNRVVNCTSSTILKKHQEDI